MCREFRCVAVVGRALVIYSSYLGYWVGDTVEGQVTLEFFLFCSVGGDGWLVSNRFFL